jgi:FtsZ-binding cell division protein ZapB
MEKELLNLILFEIREVKGDVSELKTDMREVKTRLTNVENRMTKLEERMANVEERVVNLEGRMSNVEDLGQFNKEAAESIKNVVTSHYMEFKKYIKSKFIQTSINTRKM